MAPQNQALIPPIAPTTSVVDPPLIPLPGFANKIVNLCRSFSLWPMTFGLACCAIEMMSVGMARFDLSRFGAEVFRPSPRQADLMIIAGTITRKFAPGIVRLYEQIPAPRYVLAMGNCAVSGGPFRFKGQYGIVEGVDSIVPVDVYVPGCPPRPEALLEGIFAIQKKLAGRRLFPVPPGLDTEMEQDTVKAVAAKNAASATGEQA
jgi:NADH-quinone oxidoreductase subunit B